MANKNQDLELDVEDGEAATGKSKKFIIIGIAALLLIGSAIGAYLIFSGGSDNSQSEEEVTEVKEPAQYVALPEAITSNLAGKSHSRTVQIKMSFMVRGDAAKDVVKTHMPRLKNDILMLVSQQSADELQTPDGRVKLQEASLKIVQDTLTQLVGQPTVEKVLFISFVMQ